MGMDDYLADLPKLHSFDGGATWTTGGFNSRQLAEIAETVAERGPGLSVVETGAGNSTLTFLHLDPKRVVSIAPDAALRDRIVGWCDGHGVDAGPLEFVVERSEVALPRLLLDGDGPFDVAFVDGGHGWPTVFVDFCYCAAMLRRGGLLFLDDLQLHSVAELSRLLELQDGWELARGWRKMQAWRKDTDRRWMPGHSRQPYIVSRGALPAGRT